MDTYVRIYEQHQIYKNQSSRDSGLVTNCDNLA